MFRLGLTGRLVRGDRGMLAAYKFAAQARSKITHFAMRPIRAGVRWRIVSGRQPVAFEIGGSVGLGGILSHACNALQFGREHGLDVALRFTSPLYRPSWDVDDWLDVYFVRLGPRPDRRQNVSVSILPHFPDNPREPLLLWKYLTIDPEIVCDAERLCAGAPFAAVHYRGSDKFLESARVSEDSVLNRVETEMKRDGLSRLFVASDELRFVHLAKDRFGSAVFDLPCEAMALDGRPPHFLTIPGETKAREALMTMAILARSKLCVRTPSYLSQWAMTLASDQRAIVLG
jgi:hypothetical protein